MDRFITREPRNDREHMQQNSNRMMAYSSNVPNTSNNYLPTEIYEYHGGYSGAGAPEFSGSSPMQHGGGRFSTMGVGGMGGMGGVGGAGGAPQIALPLYASAPMHPNQPQMFSDFNHNRQYLATYVDDRATVISGQARMQNDHSSYNPNYYQMTTGNYNYHSLSGPDGMKTFVPQVVPNSLQPQHNHLRPEEHVQINKLLPEMQKFTARDTQNSISNSLIPPYEPIHHNEQKAPLEKSAEVIFMKNEHENPVKSRFDKLKELHRNGPRAFSGPVEKVLKWHKSLQDLGLLIIYEVVAKCVSVRQGEWCSKHLVIRDDQGPAMQLVYYEIDYLLPELKPPCTIRVVGRMLAGTSRLHAFTIRPAVGDDVATLPRRAAVAAHHVAKLCSQYSYNAV